MVTKQHNRRRWCFKMSLCVFVALSFVVPLLPISTAAASDTMPCCAGKAGHCDSGIAPKRVPPPPSEPMCGLTAPTTEDDGITIVAESPHSHSQAAENSSPVESDSSRPAAESNSLSQTCRMDCGACLASLNRQQKRVRLLVQTFAIRSLSPITRSRFEYSSLPSASSDYWEHVIPRGPPADLL